MIIKYFHNNTLKYILNLRLSSNWFLKLIFCDIFIKNGFLYLKFQNFFYFKFLYSACG